MLAEKLGYYKGTGLNVTLSTEPTVSNLVDSGKAYIIVDTRTAAGAQAALDGLYPATSLYMSTSYVNSHRRPCRNWSTSTSRR